MGCFIHRVEEQRGIEFGRIYHRRAATLVMCGQDNDEPHCFDCADFGEFLCDYPVGNDKTCDRPMCEQHRHGVAPELDYCTTHYAEWESFRDSGAPLKHFETVIPFRAEKTPK